MRVGIKSSISQLLPRLRADCHHYPLLHDLFHQNQLIFEELQDISCENNYEIIVADPGLISSRLDHSFHNLKWLQSTFAGVNRIMEDSTRDDYILTRIGEGFGPQMVEYVLGWILTFQLKIPLSMKQKEMSTWDQTPYLTRGTLENQTIGILGTGNIGAAVARGCRNLGMKPIGFCRDPKPYIESNSSTFDLYTNSLETLISQSAYIVNTLPSTPNTKYLLNSQLFSSSRNPQLPPPIFINIGRGDVISSSEIINSVSSGSLTAAVLDVFETEPLPSDHPLYTTNGIYITPHISALSTANIVSTNFLKNLEIYLQFRGRGLDTPHSALQDSLHYVVHRTKGY